MNKTTARGATSLQVVWQEGLTLVELLVTLVITGLIITAGVAISLNNQQLFKRESVHIEARANTRTALEILVEDLRFSGYNPKETSVFDSVITDAQIHSIEMRMDLDTNGVLNNGEECSYTVSNDTLYKNITGVGSSIIAENIDYLEFRYLNANGSELTRPVVFPQIDSISAIKVIIVGRTSKELFKYHEGGNYPDGTPYSDRYYRCWDSTFVRLRNI